MKSTVIKRSISIFGHKTSVSLEDAFWKGLGEIARGRGLSLSEMAAVISSEREYANLSSAIRLFVLGHYRSLMGAAADEPNPHQEEYGTRPGARIPPR